MNKTVAFAIESDVEVIAGTTPCNATMKHRSVIGSETVEFITEPGKIDGFFSSSPINTQG